MAAPQLEALFGKLDTQLKNHQTKRALKTVDEVLKLAPEDADALGCKVALLIELGSVADAIKVIDGTPALAGPLAFERAYCSYREGRLQEALGLLAAVPPERAADRLQLEAQLQYRLGNYTEAAALYTRLFQEHDVAATDARANLLAAYVAGGRAGEVAAVMSALGITPRASFEVAFNVACGLVVEGRLPEAEEQLQVAHKVGEEQLYEEELEEDEVAAELAPVAAQLAYVAAQAGRWEEGLQGLQQVSELAGSSNDDAVAATVATNLCAALLRRRPGDRRAAAEGLKKLEPFVERTPAGMCMRAAVQARLGSLHCEAFLGCYAAAAISANKPDAAREALRQLERQVPAAACLPLLRASLLVRDSKAKEAAAALAAAAPAVVQSPADRDIQLMRAQLATAAGDLASALALLDALPQGDKDRPAVVATRVALLEKHGDSAGARAVLEEALCRSTGEVAAVRWVQRRLAGVEAQGGNLGGAVSHLQALVQADPAALDDPEILTLLPRLVALSSPSAAPSLRQQLPPPPTLAPAAVDALEAGGVSVSASQRKALDAAGKRKEGEEGEDAAAKKTVKKRKRKPRYPKGFDPANPGPPPDPERWLPKWQRSDAKKAKKKRRDKSEVVKGSQGAGLVDASLDKSGAAPVAAAEAAPAVRPPAGKKKGKGRR